LSQVRLIFLPFEFSSNTFFFNSWTFKLSSKVGWVLCTYYTIFDARESVYKCSVRHYLKGSSQFWVPMIVKKVRTYEALKGPLPYIKHFWKKKCSTILLVWKVSCTWQSHGYSKFMELNALKNAPKKLQKRLYINYYNIEN
jgi:hypothetical protein